MKVVFICIFCTLTVSLVLKNYVIANFTESEPTGIYLLSKENQYNKNDIVTISNNINSIIRLSRERKYTSTNRLVKTVMGIPGDIISIKNRIIYINDSAIGKIFTVDSQNRPLPSIIKEGIIPPDQYFLASSRHENSFDSRYFGLISKECIQKKASPLWTY
jgi:conjugative transfer signal peptidase TraF